MEDEPLVSVGIPTYNRPAGLRHTLECITTQTYRNLEIIISDNASPNLKEELVAIEFQKRDDRIQYYRQQENKGISINFQFVLKKSHGKYFMWAADDDSWNERYIEECINVMEAHPEVSLCYSEPVLLNYQGHEKMLCLSDMSTLGMDKLAGIRKILLNQKRNTEFYGILRTNLAKKYKFKKYFGEDHSFVLFIAMQGKIAKIESGLFISGHVNNISSSIERQVVELGLPLWSKYFVYVKLHFEMIKLVFQRDNGLCWYEKFVVPFFIFERVFFVSRNIRGIVKGFVDFFLILIKVGDTLI